MKKDNLKSFKTVACQSCQGFGFDKVSIPCQHCQGKGTYAKLGNYVFSLQKPSNPTSVDGHFRITLAISILAELWEKLVFISGFFILLYWLWLWSEAGISLYESVNSPSWLSFGFWLAGINLLILFFWFFRGRKAPCRIPQQTYFLFDNPEEALERKNENLTNIPVNKTFTWGPRSAFKCAFEYCYKHKLKYLSPPIFLLTIMKDSLIDRVFNRLDIDKQKFKADIKQKIHLNPQLRINDHKIYLTPAMQQMVYCALEETIQSHKKHISNVQFTIASVLADPLCKRVFLDYDIEVQELRNTCYWVSEEFNKHKSRWTFWRRKFYRSGNLDAGWTKGWTNTLDKYSSDITKMAAEGYFPPIVEREHEIETGIHALEKTYKNSLLLIGKPGTGKSSIIYAISKRIIRGNVPEQLRNKRIIELNLGAMFSNTKNEAAVQSRFVEAVKEVSHSSNVILYIPNIHTLFGVGSDTENSLDVTGVLKPLLKTNSLQCIASTTPEAFTAVLENKDAFTNFFQFLHIREPNPVKTIRILEVIVPEIERKQKIIFSYEALKEAVHLSQNYLHDRFLPDKAIDLLDEAAVVTQNRKKKSVNKEIIRELVSKKTGIPISDPDKGEADKLLNLEELLHQRIIGQDNAVKAVSGALRRARSGLKDNNKPIAAFLFLGPTGVGKTELAKALAEVYFGNEKNMIRLDMSEFQNQTDIHKLIGAPPGSGGTEKGILTQKVKKNPFSLVLLDEIEKSHPRIMDLFLQVLDDGRLTDSTGTTVYFNNAIIIGTSNAAAHLIQESIRKNMPYEAMRENVMEFIQKNYRPEFLNRFDGLIIFKPLSPQQIKKITKLLLQQLKNNLKMRDIEIEITPETVKKLAKKGYNPQFGARALQRVIQEEVKDFLAHKILSGEIQKGGKIII